MNQMCGLLGSGWKEWMRCLGGLAVVWGLLASAAMAAEPAAIDFAHQIVPVLRKHCASCHAGKKAEGGFSINTRELVLDAGVVEPGKSDDSYLLDLITTDDSDLQMPPAGNPRVPATAVAAIRQWVDSGLPWEPGFSFAGDAYEPPLAPRRPTLPPSRDGREHPIDRIIDTQLASQQTTSPELIDDATFYRRVSLDLVGLLPVAAEVEKFVADSSPTKREDLVEQLLDNRSAYAQHWLTFWNDMLRNDYVGTGYIDGGRKPIHQWLYRSLLENKPYDQFVRELIAPTDESAGFIRGIKWRGAVNSSQTQEIQFSQNVSQVFLGINLKCASCHDSFIDRWTLQETYDLAALYSERPLEIHRCDKPTGKFASGAWLFPELGQVDASAPQPERLQQLSQLLTDPENGRFARTIVNRLWYRLMGRGIVHPVDAMQTKPWNEDLLDQLATELVDSGYDLKHVLQLIVTSQAYQSQTALLRQPPAAGEYHYHGPIAKRMTAEQFVDAVWQITGTGPQQPHAQAAAMLTAAGDTQAGAAGIYRAALVESDLLMRSLGRPNREQVVTSRPELLTTLQALDLSNSPILVATLRKGAENVVQKYPPEQCEQFVNDLYLQALSRMPTQSERDIALEIVGAPMSVEGCEDLLWAVLMLPEFQIVR
ncbi:PSD1 and planctomycete cytochrome C domain-containing protein [Aeoliella mucimassa]|uniref:Planctomycete cytochrome C n=1 Tax=Aeoliella mucimassa TaxID=2527972 RepID=A0A518ALW7_9BACT|nr:PSD1 and planctomycete cytochrome C domain-containing protein [Aeoliella mucimassa]QDU55725.1 Planctomycete cytochrome C [Aeoliella mucimassa]